MAWSHLAARFLYGQHAQGEVGPHVRHWFGIWLLYTLVESATSPVDVVAILQAGFLTRQLVLAALCFPSELGPEAC